MKSAPIQMWTEVSNPAFMSFWDASRKIGSRKYDFVHVKWFWINKKSAQAEQFLFSRGTFHEYGTNLES